MRPFVGCVVTYHSDRPIESVYFDREWIIWDKKGYTVWLFEHMGDKQGPPLFAFGYDYECRFVSTEYSPRRFYPNGTVL